LPPSGVRIGSQERSNFYPPALPGACARRQVTLGAHRPFSGVELRQSRR
jgi:hypothetical protein